MAINFKPQLQPLDRVAIPLMLALTLLIGILWWGGDAVRPKVRNFSWQNQLIGADDTAFTLTFSHPMDTKSVEANLAINPPLPGKVSWAGRRMAYTLLAPAPYDTNYTVHLQGAIDQFTEEKPKNRLLQPFTGNFQSRDRAFVYLGSQGEEQGRLVLYNLTRAQKTLLTSKELVVVDFKPYPSGEKVLFSATERALEQPNSLLSPQIYTVTTGLPNRMAEQSAPPGKVDLVLDNKDYQNLKFELSPDGKTIVVQRVNQHNPGDFDFWLIRPSGPPQPMKAQPGGDFIITPDSQALAVSQGQGVAILPLQAPAQKPLDFLPEFGLVLNFTKDGSSAAMVKFNSDYTRSLFLVTNLGQEKQIFRTTGSILSAQFDPTNQILYCLLTKLLTGKTYQEQPYIAAINLKTGKKTDLITLPNQRDMQWSLSPDGLVLLFDQVLTTTPAPLNESMPTNTKAITSGHLWLLPLMSAQLQPTELPLPGFHPSWLP